MADTSIDRLIANAPRAEPARLCDRRWLDGRLCTCVPSFYKGQS